MSMSQRRAIVSGGGGFIGGHLVNHLVNHLVEAGYQVRAVDQRPSPYGPSAAHEYVVADLRRPDEAAAAFDGGADEVYQLAADMGGMDFISSAEAAIMRNNIQINLGALDAAVVAGVDRFFFASSVCIYRNMELGEQRIDEEAAYPALPTTSTAGRSSTRSAPSPRTPGPTASQPGSPVSRTAMGLEAPGSEAVRRRPPPSAERSPRHPTAAPSRSTAAAARTGLSSTSATWCVPSTRS